MRSSFYGSMVDLQTSGITGVSRNYGYHFGVPRIGTVVFWGSILGSPFFWETTLQRRGLAAWINSLVLRREWENGSP